MARCTQPVTAHLHVEPVYIHVQHSRAGVFAAPHTPDPEARQEPPTARFLHLSCDPPSALIIAPEAYR